MGIEIEKKFLINYNDWIKNKNIFTSNKPFYYIKQGYISSSTNTIRIRLLDIIPENLSYAFITLKGKQNNSTRSEFEYEIPVNDAKQIMNEMCSSFIEKYRFIYNDNEYIWEFDEFLGDNKGLIIAELEFNNTNKINNFKKPFYFIGKELKDSKYSNYNLSKNPYCSWNI